MPVCLACPVRDMPGNGDFLPEVSLKIPFRGQGPVEPGGRDFQIVRGIDQFLHVEQIADLPAYPGTIVDRDAIRVENDDPQHLTVGFAPELNGNQLQAKLLAYRPDKIGDSVGQPHIGTHTVIKKKAGTLPTSQREQT